MPAHLRGEPAQLGVQGAGKIGGQGLQSLQLALQAAHLLVAEDPAAVVVDLVDALQGDLDLVDGVAFGLVVAHAEVGPHGLLHLLAIFGQPSRPPRPTRRETARGPGGRAAASGRRGRRRTALARSPRNSLSVMRSSLTWLLTSAASGNSFPRQLKLLTRLR